MSGLEYIVRVPGHLVGFGALGVTLSGAVRVVERVGSGRWGSDDDA